jgi:hypothetical protein
MINIYLPNNLNFLVLNKKSAKIIYFYNKSFFFFFNINNFNYFFNSNLQILKLKQIKPINANRNFSELLNKFFFIWENFLYNKILFTGKGFKLKKKKNNIQFFFNHSHLNLFIYLNIYLKKIQKTKLVFFFKNYENFGNFLQKIIKIRKNNIYTKRGLRLSRQLVLKRKGKSN